MAVVGTLTNTPVQATFYIEWKVSEFTSLAKEAGKFVCSPLFSFLGESYFLEIYPNGNKNNDAVGYISLYLKRKSISTPDIDIDFSFGFKTLEGDKFYVNHDSLRTRNCGRHRMVLRSELIRRHSEFLPFNELTVFCSLKCSKYQDTNPLCTSIPALENNGTKILLDFKELFLKKEDCDVIIKVQEQEFPAHRFILKARSSVFAATFRNDMKEKATGIVEINDCDSSSFSEFLCFLYCGSGNISVENVFNLYVTADKYDVQDLKTKCLVFMEENLSIDTFCDTITLALRHSEKELMESATYFFLRNVSKIVVTDKWKVFSAENHTHSHDLIVKFLAPDASVSK